MLQGALVGPGVAGVTLAACDTDNGVPPLDNGYVAAPPQPRVFAPPRELDRTGEGYAELPSANGARLYYWDTGGNGEPIVMVHAATGSAYVGGTSNGYSRTPDTE